MTASAFCFLKAFCALVPPYQVNEGGKWFCDRCTTFSDDNPAKVQDHIMLAHCLPKEYWEGKKTLEDLKKLGLLFHD